MFSLSGRPVSTLIRYLLRIAGVSGAPILYQTFFHRKASLIDIAIEDSRYNTTKHSREGGNTQSLSQMFSSSGWPVSTLIRYLLRIVGVAGVSILYQTYFHCNGRPACKQTNWTQQLRIAGAIYFSEREQQYTAFKALQDERHI